METVLTIFYRIDLLRLQRTRQKCDERFSDRKCLYKHVREKHDEMIQDYDLFSTLCPLCEMDFKKAADLDHHIISTHEHQLETKTIVFNSDQEFKTWKSTIEKDTMFFSVRTINDTRTFYQCHRSGSSRQTGKGKRLKWNPSCRTGRSCTARITITTSEDGKVTRRAHSVPWTPMTAKGREIC